MKSKHWKIAFITAAAVIMVLVIGWVIVDYPFVRRLSRKGAENLFEKYKPLYLRLLNATITGGGATDALANLGSDSVKEFQKKIKTGEFTLEDAAANLQASDVTEAEIKEFLAIRKKLTLAGYVFDINTDVNEKNQIVILSATLLSPSYIKKA